MGDKINSHCLECIKDCKQLEIIRVVNCKYFEPKSKKSKKIEEEQ